MILLEGLTPAAKRRAEQELTSRLKNVTAKSIIKEKVYNIEKAKTIDVSKNRDARSLDTEMNQHIQQMANLMAG